MGFWACGVGPSGFLGCGSLYKHKIINLGKKWCIKISSMSTSPGVKCTF